MKLQAVSLNSVENLTEVRGKYANFTFAPKILENGLAGDRPRARFLRTNDGIFVPTDLISQEMSVIYAHLQRLFELDAQAGVGDLLSWPRKVGIAVRIRDEQGLMSDNSFYDAGSDSILMVPFKDGHLPLAVNSGVIAHEHFHALFYRMVQAPLISKGKLSKTISASAHAENELKAYFQQNVSNQGSIEGGEKPGGEEPAPTVSVLSQEKESVLYHTVLMKAVNEGLADVWGWIYSGNPDFLGESLPVQKECRSLRADHGCAIADGHHFSSRAALKESIAIIRSSSLNPDGSLNNFSYRPGTELSRALRSTFLTVKDDRSAEGKAERLKLASRIVRALPGLVLQLASEKIGEEIDVEGVYRLILAAEPLSEKEKAKSNVWLKAAAPPDSAIIKAGK